MNIYLQEAMERQEINMNSVVKDIKAQLRMCKLTKFQSNECCSKFFSSFFLQSLPNDVHPSSEEWGSIYAQLLGDSTVADDLAKFIVMWHPAIYEGMFVPFMTLIQTELNELKQNRLRFLSLRRATLNTVHLGLDGVANIVRTQATPDPETTKFITTVDQTLRRMDFDINALIQKEIRDSIEDGESPVVVRRSFEAIPLEEDAKDLVELLESADRWIAEHSADYLDESIVNNAVEKVKAGAVALKKAENEFDEMVMRKVRSMRENRRNRKHAEMVGEALRINHEIKRLLVSGAIGILNPTIGILTWFVTLMIDRHTDKKDRQILVNQLKDELEIVEEKINMAERNGDEKARIELIRFRQKLQHEYERIMEVRFDSAARAKMKRWG